MLPKQELDLREDFKIVTHPTKTYRLNIPQERVYGQTDGLAAMEQAIAKLLSTTRYAHQIYSWRYGLELDDLLGEPIPDVYPEIEQRITEALMQDDRIQGVDQFAFTHNRGQVDVTFTVHTTLGDISGERKVRI